MPSKQLSHILVGDHLGQVKKVLWPSGEISTLSGLGTPSSSRPIVSIETVLGHNKQLIANRKGQLYVYDCIQDATIECESVEDGLIKAIPISVGTDKINTIYFYQKQVVINGQNLIQSVKKNLKGEIYNGKFCEDNLAIVGKDISLKIYDVNKKVRIFDSDPPEKNWLGIRAETFVSGVDFIGNNPDRIATCSKSDSVIRIYDLKTKQSSKPVISIDINDTAFNEHADSSRFISIASVDHSSSSNYPIVVGSNVGQILALDVRFNQKHTSNKRKKLQPKSYKILGGFKGCRGSSVKDVKIVSSSSLKNHSNGDDDNLDEEDDSGSSHENKVISCSLDRYLRVHKFTKTSRHLDKHVYLKTKPMCCSPVFHT